MNKTKRTPSSHCNRSDHLHTKTVHRWCARKKDEHSEHENQFQADAQDLGSVRWLCINRGRAIKARKEKTKAYYAMLATTSLKNLIK